MWQITFWNSKEPERLALTQPVAKNWDMTIVPMMKIMSQSCEPCGRTDF